MIWWLNHTDAVINTENNLRRRGEKVDDKIREIDKAVDLFISEKNKCEKEKSRIVDALAAAAAAAADQDARSGRPEHAEVYMEKDVFFSSDSFKCVSIFFLCSQHHMHPHH